MRGTSTEGAMTVVAGARLAPQKALCTATLLQLHTEPTQLHPASASVMLGMLALRRAPGVTPLAASVAATS